MDKKENLSQNTQQNDFAHLDADANLKASEDNRSPQPPSDGKRKQKSFFFVMGVVLIVLMIVAIVVQIFVMINLKRRTDELNHRNDQLPEFAETTNADFFEKENNVVFQLSKTNLVVYKNI